MPAKMSEINRKMNFNCELKLISILLTGKYGTFFKDNVTLRNFFLAQLIFSQNLIF